VYYSVQFSGGSSDSIDLSKYLEGKTIMKFFVLLCIAVVVSSCSSESDEKNTVGQPADVNAVAQVGERLVTEADIDAEVLLMPAQYQAKKDDAQFRAKVLQGLLDRLVLVEKAKLDGVADNVAIKAKMERAGQAVLIAGLEKRRRAGEVSDADIQQYYEKNKAQFVVPERVSVRQILVDSGKEASTLLRRLEKGEDFATLAKKTSIDSRSKAQGGELEPFGLGMMLPPLSAVVFKPKA